MAVDWNSARFFTGIDLVIYWLAINVEYNLASTWPITTSIPWDVQSLPEPELCWNRTDWKRPQNKLETIIIFSDTPLINCRTFCHQRYADCKMIAYSEATQTCKLYDSVLTWMDMSLDTSYVTEVPFNCTYDIAYENERDTWTLSNSACIARGGVLASVMDLFQARKLLDVVPMSATEFWVGVKYSSSNSEWMWENGVEATRQSYFRNLTADTSNGPICGKARVVNLTTSHRVIRIEPALCDLKLPAACQFKYGILEAEEVIGVDIPRSNNSILGLMVDIQPTLKPTLPAEFLNTTIYIPPITTRPTTQATPTPRPQTAAPFSTDPVSVGIGASMSFFGVGIIIFLVILDVFTIGKEFARMKENLTPCIHYICYSEPNPIDPSDTLENNHKMEYGNDDIPDYDVSMSRYTDYDQMFTV